MANVTVIGGHGKVAQRLIPLLVEDGHDVTAWVRNPQHVQEVAESGARVMEADVEQLDTDELVQRLRGQDAVIWSAGAGGGSPQRTYAVDRDAAIRSMDAAIEARADRYVMVSYFYHRPDHGVPEDNSFFPYAEAKAAADEHLQQSRLRWTILGPSALTDDPGTGGIETGDGVTASSVSRDDVAAVAAYVVSHPSTVGRVIDFNSGDTPIAEALG